MQEKSHKIYNGTSILSEEVITLITSNNIAEPEMQKYECLLAKHRCKYSRERASERIQKIVHLEEIQFTVADRVVEGEVAPQRRLPDVGAGHVDNDL